MPEALDRLLGQLSAGDGAAAAEVFTAFEPYLRKAVRRHISPLLRAKFDSSDILQSVAPGARPRRPWPSLSASQVSLGDRPVVLKIVPRAALEHLSLAR